MLLKKYALSIVLLGLVFTSCRKDDVPTIEKENRNTVLMVLIGDNSLSGYLNQDMDNVVNNMDPAYLKDNTFLIYIDTHQNGNRPATPQLLEIIPDADGKSTTQVLIDFPEQNSADTAVLAYLFDIMRQDYPADQYGLIMGSHADAWLPSDANFNSRAIGQDGNNWIEMDELAEVIPSDFFEYIIFDACFMASVEVSYALRDKTEYILGAPTEMWANGFPYEQFGPCFVGKNIDYNTFCDALYNKYVNGDGMTISLIRTTRMNDLTRLARQVLYGKEAQILANGTTGLQKFGRSGTVKKYGDMFFDLGDFIKKYASVAQYQEFEALMAQIVPYYRYTPTAFYFKINSYSGLSVYVPQTRYPFINDYYNTVEWAQAVYQDQD